MIYPKRPKDFRPAFEVVSCLLEYNNTLLFLKRHRDKPYGGKWGIPTGKVNHKEERVNALIREVFEETGVTIKKEQVTFFRSLSVTHFDNFIYHLYHYQLDSKPNILLSEKEHDAYVWAPIEKASELDLIEDLDTCIQMFYL